MFKGATHLSLERAPSSKHSRDGVCKQMAYERCGSSPADWTRLVVSEAIPTVSFHRRGSGGRSDFHVAASLIEPSRNTVGNP